MTSPGGRGGIGGAQSLPVIPCFPLGPVHVVGMLLDDFISMGIEIAAIHAPVMRSGNDLPQMADDSIDEKGIAELIPVHAPGIGGADAHHFQRLPLRMIAPDTYIHFHAGGFIGAGFSQGGNRLNTMSTVEPTVRPPAQAVGDGVMIHLPFESVEFGHRRAIRAVITIGVRNEDQFRQSEGPDPAESDF